MGIMMNNEEGVGSPSFPGAGTPDNADCKDFRPRRTPIQQIESTRYQRSPWIMEIHHRGKLIFRCQVSKKVTERISSLCIGKPGYSSISRIKLGIVRLVLINNLEFRRLMRKTTQREEMAKLSLYLPVRVIDSAERCKGFYSLNRWVWKAIEKALEEEEMAKIAVKV